ncbi:HAMP domain-containing sensor histidine kinase [Chitinophaga sancti]|uniref:sensor histidine kinase n=1 Tax=Chitinophaga sancti TaxID=1004 RepID=UPI002A75E615|nr:HAMP domain-containing sensor histidine kinase [Chitinophaga sancti]WPQ60735.1 HAMP domain-containing sensor histidine kinase [Chitinophaga sancti]
MRNVLARLSNLWEKLVGDPAAFSLENRAFNSISVITLALLTVLLPFNMWLGLTAVWIIVLVLLFLQVFFFWLSRFKGLYSVSMLAYVIVSYITLTATYYLNSGSHGPALLLFFLTFNLLIAFSPRNRHWIWASLHLLIPIALLTKEYLQPSWIADIYQSAQNRFIDLASSYFVTLTCTFLITNYLRNNYNREKKKAEDRADKIDIQNVNLEQLNQKKDKLFSIIAHDLQSPLNSIITTLHLIAEYELSQDERKMLGDELLTMTKNTSNMLTNLLTWSKMQMDGRGVRLSPVHVYEVVQRVLAIQQILADKKSVTLTSKIDPAVYVTADNNMLELIIRNLVNNAIKFTPNNGQVKISLLVKDGICQLMVADNGIGIESSHKEEIFSLKTQSTFGTNNEKGIGLGLVLCKELQSLQHGELWFESLPGKGTTFYATIPVADPAADGRITA